RGGFRTVNCYGLIGLHFYFEHRLSALNAIAANQVRFGNLLAVHESAVGRTQVAQKAARRRNLQQAMMAREKFVFGKIKVGAVAAADQKCVVLIESELAPAVRAGQNS